LFLHAGRLQVLPIIRLFEERRGDAKASPPEYLTLAAWLHDVFTRWQFPVLRRNEKWTPSAATLQGLLGTSDPPLLLRTLARVIWFALFGARARSHCRLDRNTLLFLPRQPRSLRPVVQTPMGEAAARGLVITARRLIPDSGASASGTQPSGLPQPVPPARRYQMQPTQTPDWGLDPVHTPEGSNIRYVGHLAVGARIEERLLVFPKDQLPLSVSTSRLPYAGHNDPRRLLMAANMQVHAIPLAEPEVPRVASWGTLPTRPDRRGHVGNVPHELRRQAEPIDPPGVNLRVGYLAWQGWNHEDAWVISESAARKLRAAFRVVHTLLVRSVELPPRLLVAPGDQVDPGQKLLERRVAPALLVPSLEQLASLSGLDQIAALEPDPLDSAPCAGRVEAVETWNLYDRTGLPAHWHVPAHVPGLYRQVTRIHLCRELPLAVGDKLANRHGHKGIVGQILRDDEMPRWRDEPLEALIDPISVLNRSNWGQIVEALAGASTSAGESLEAGSHSVADILARARALNADAQGRWLIEPPVLGNWLKQPVAALAGVTFVMRMPQTAGDHLPPRRQRFGEMDQWALWAHSVADPSACQRTAPGEDAKEGEPADRWRRLLYQAAFKAQANRAGLSIRELRLNRPPPRSARPVDIEGHTLPELFDALESLEEPHVVLIDPPVTEVSLPGPHGQPARKATVRWVPICPSQDRPRQVHPDGSAEDHELTRCLRRVLRAIVYRRGDERAATHKEARARHAIQALLRTAYHLAVGLTPAGSKRSYLRRRVLGRPLPASGRALIAPAGTLGLGLDEVGLPPALVRAIAAKGSAPADWVWIKRDPVLHRWGFLPVRWREIPGQTLRLPASILGPMGADFDGDSMAVFGHLAGLVGSPEAVRPSALAWDGLLERGMFFPGKQYLFGLYLLTRAPAKLQALGDELKQAGAPSWPEAAELRQALDAWLQAAVRAQPRGQWWAILERHALEGLAGDPGMGVGLMELGALGRLAVVTCGAAKSDLFAPDAESSRENLERILAGAGLEIYRPAPSAGREPADPIAAIMAAARASVGLFGGALRRLLFRARGVSAEWVRQAQAVTEQATQKVLSVKAGQRPLPYRDFERLLAGPATASPPGGSTLHELYMALDKAGVWQRIHEQTSPETPSWLMFLHQPYRLAELVRRSPGRVLRLPYGDLRASAFKLLRDSVR
jgi:hypothetical protein